MAAVPPAKLSARVQLNHGVTLPEAGTGLCTATLSWHAPAEAPGQAPTVVTEFLGLHGKPWLAGRRAGRWAGWAGLHCGAGSTRRSSTAVLSRPLTRLRAARHRHWRRRGA